MDLLTFLGIYGAFILVFIFVALFGHLPVFNRTPVASLHWLFSHGIGQGLRWIAKQSCGNRGLYCLEWLDRACCKSRNPATQALYVALVFGGYYLYSREIFMFLPQPYAPLWHQHTAALAIGLCLLTFWVTSKSDPGYITADNLAAHLHLYPFDGITSTEKECWTCHRPRPARSKHCPLCDRCVARFDHHCGWVNNCIGLQNIRFFLAFLLSNLFACLYGATLAPIIMFGMVQRLGVLERPIMDHNTGGLILLKHRPLLLARWTVSEFPVQVLLAFFLLLAAVFVGAFLAYHLWLIAKGTTTYETVRWAEEREDKELEMLTQEHTPIEQTAWWKRLRRKDQPRIIMPPNIYDRGIQANFMEVLFPDQAFSRSRPKQF